MRRIRDFPTSRILTRGIGSRNSGTRAIGLLGTNLCGEAEFLERFRAFIRSLFADPTGQAPRWGFKEIRYGQTVHDRALRLMFDCFPETRLIILVREPGPTIFSMLSHWAFSSQRHGNIPADELDRQILAAADSWNTQYMHLQCLLQAHAPNCLPVRYEDLGNPTTYHKLAIFLKSQSFDYKSHVGKVKDASSKADPTALLIRRRIEFLQPQIASATCGGRTAYGYSSTVSP
jgi:hypothetical protein